LTALIATSEAAAPEKDAGLEVKSPSLTGAVIATVGGVALAKARGHPCPGRAPFSWMAPLALHSQPQLESTVPVPVAV
jgi:hypothetical protein